MHVCMIIIIHAYIFIHYNLEGYKSNLDLELYEYIKKKRSLGKYACTSCDHFIYILHAHIHTCIVEVQSPKSSPKKKIRLDPDYWIKELCLYSEDHTRILNTDWLTDNVIDATQILLKKKYPKMGGLQSTVLGVNLTFSIERGKFVQIINVRNSHWITISNAMSQTLNEISVYDSKPSWTGVFPRKAIEQIAALICSGEKQFTLNFQPVQVQRGSDDCGLFAIAFAESLCSGASPSSLRYTQESLRSHLLKCLDNRAITPFPSTKRRPVKSNRLQVVPVFCFCRQIEKGHTVECSGCKDWYHVECVHFPSNFPKKEKWYCSNCSS